MISNLFRRTYKQRRISKNEIKQKIQALPTSKYDGKYVFHTTNISGLQNILKDEYMYSSSKTKKVQLADRPLKKIFMNMLFSPIKLKADPYCVLVFDFQELLKHYKIHYSDYAQFGKFEKDSSSYIHTMNNVPDLIKRSKTLKTRRYGNFFNYTRYYYNMPEIVIHSESIPLKFLKLVIIPETNLKKIDKSIIEKIKTKYPHIQFYTKMHGRVLTRSIDVDTVHKLIENKE